MQTPAAGPLSFRDDLAAGDSAAECSLAAATARRFASPPRRPAPAAERQPAAAASAAPTDAAGRLTSVISGRSQALGLRPYQEDRTCVVADLALPGGRAFADGTLRTYAAVFDGAATRARAAAAAPAAACCRRRRPGRRLPPPPPLLTRRNC